MKIIRFTHAVRCSLQEMSGGVSNVSVLGFVGVNVSTGLRIKTAASRGGYVRGIRMEDARLEVSQQTTERDH